MNESHETKVNLPKPDKSRIEKFTAGTTLHGVGYIANRSHHPARRVLWACVLIVLTAWLVYGIATGVTKYFTYPVSTSIVFNYAKNNTFPAITICNYNQFKRSHVERTMKNNSDDTEVLSKLMYSLATGETREIDWTKYEELYGDKPWNMTDVSRRTGHRLEDMLKICVWNKGETCDVRNFTTVFTDFGMCYTFNDVMNERHLTVTQAGSAQGLRLRLTAEQDEYYWGYYNSAGFKLHVHPKGEFPLVEKFGISVTPGFETSIKITNVISRSRPAPYRSNCSDLVLDHSSVYSAQQCWYDCQSKAITRQCGCRYYKLAGSEDMCDPEQIVKCVIPALEDYSTSQNTCDCPEPCTHESYDTKMSVAHWPNNFALSRVAKLTNDSEEHIKSNLLEVFIYFDVLGYQEILQLPSYDFFDLQSDVGAYMGLLCGASIVTIVEFMDFGLAGITKRLRRNSRE